MSVMHRELLKETGMHGPELSQINEQLIVSTRTYGIFMMSQCTSHKIPIFLQGYFLQRSDFTVETSGRSHLTQVITVNATSNGTSHSCEARGRMR